MAASRNRGKVSSEVLQRLGRAGVDAHLEQGVAFLPGRALNGHGQPGLLLPLLGEDQRRKLLGTGAEDEPCGRGNLSIGAAERMSFPAIRCAVYPAKGSVRPQIDFANGERHTARVPPTYYMFGLGPGLEDERAAHRTAVLSRFGGRRES